MAKSKLIVSQDEDIETAILNPKSEISVKTKTDHKQVFVSHKRWKIIILVGVFIFLSGYAFATSLFFHRSRHHFNGRNHFGRNNRHGHHHHRDDHSLRPDEITKIDEKIFPSDKMMEGPPPMNYPHADHMRPHHKTNNHHGGMRAHPKDHWEHEPSYIFLEV